MDYLIIYALAYLLGSVPFGLILAKTFAKVDIKKQGSKSIGATNVLRVVKESNPVLAKKLAIATIVLDFSKATLPLLILKNLGYDLNLLWSVAVLVVFGHCFSIYLLLEGGKGVATAAGAMIVLLPLE
ncbi:MAG: glycerol-3-phosphate acyltransferase, partial [Campylobacter sp.]|nr:glycerol-3-phosphate acyltransferase [Campylobacter sp.]